LWIWCFWWEKDGGYNTWIDKLQNERSSVSSLDFLLCSVRSLGIALLPPRRVYEAHRRGSIERQRGAGESGKTASKAEDAEIKKRIAYLEDRNKRLARMVEIVNEKV